MIGTEAVVKVGIADMKTVRPPAVIRTTGLGSCVGVILYDKEKKLAGLIHVMLPDSALGKAESLNPAKFADTAVPAMAAELRKDGATNLRAKLAGGAQMFQFASVPDSMRIGPRNVEAVKARLKELGIPVAAEDTGGSSGRTIEFDPQTGILSVRTVNEGTKEI